MAKKEAEQKNITKESIAAENAAAAEAQAEPAPEPKCYDFEGIVRALGEQGVSSVKIEEFTADPETGALVGKVFKLDGEVLAEVRLAGDRVVVQSHGEI